MLRQSLRPTLYGILITSCLALLLCGRQSLSTVNAAHATPGTDGKSAPTMPKQCKPGKTSTQAMGWHWNRNAHVKVYYLSGDFSEEEREALSRAVNNWNDALREMEAHISFTVGGTLTDVSEENLSLTVVRGIPRSRDRVGEVKLYSLSNGTNHVTVVIGPNVKSTEALTSLMTHEIGHSLGLADCYECKQGTTAMAAFHDMKKGNEVYEPSECDRYVVATGYANEMNADARIVSTSR